MELKPKSNNFLNGIIFAISFFSILPISLKNFEADDKFYEGVIWGLPIVGILLSFISIFIFYIFSTLFTPLYGAFLSSIFYLVSYGFLHLEAVCDTIDGWYVSLSNKEVYEVMKEPQIGAMGAIGGFCLILVKLFVLSYLFYLQAFFVIVISLILSRFTLYFVLDFEFHKKSFFLISMQKVKKRFFFIDLFLFPIKLILKYILNKVKKRIGFINGDVVGFSIEIIEILALHIGLFIVLF